MSRHGRLGKQLAFGTSNAPGGMGRRGEESEAENSQSRVEMNLGE